jgi:hypothetical protein
MIWSFYTLMKHDRRHHGEWEGVAKIEELKMKLKEN